MGSCFTSPRKFSSISQASSFSFLSFWEFIVASMSILSFVSESLLFSDLRLLFGRGYPELVVHAVEDELDGDSLSEARCPELECLSYVEFVDTTSAAAAAAAACLAAPLLDKLSNVATADVFSIRAALFIE